MRNLYIPNGDILKKWLLENHYSYATFADKAGIKTCTVYNFINEKRKTSDKTLRKIYDITGIEFNNLIKIDSIDLDINL